MSSKEGWWRSLRMGNTAEPSGEAVLPLMVCPTVEAMRRNPPPLFDPEPSERNREPRAFTRCQQRGTILARTRDGVSDCVGAHYVKVGPGTELLLWRRIWRVASYARFPGRRHRAQGGSDPRRGVAPRRCAFAPLAELARFLRNEARRPTFSFRRPLLG